MSEYKQKSEPLPEVLKNVPVLELGQRPKDMWRIRELETANADLLAKIEELTNKTEEKFWDDFEKEIKHRVENGRCPECGDCECHKSDCSIGEQEQSIAEDYERQIDQKDRIIKDLSEQLELAKQAAFGWKNGAAELQQKAAAYRETMEYIRENGEGKSSMWFNMTVDHAIDKTLTFTLSPDPVMKAANAVVSAKIALDTAENGISTASHMRECRDNLDLAINNLAAALGDKL